MCRPPREAWPLARVLGLVLMKMARTGLALEPRRRPQAGKSGDPRSQNTDTYVIKEVYHSGAIKINNFEGTNPKMVNGQRIKHYISGNPINVETNVIETVIPEEYIRDTLQNLLDSEKE